MQLQEAKLCHIVSMPATQAIPIFRESRYDVVRLHYGVRASMMVHRNKKTIQCRDQESCNGVKRGWDLAEDVIAITFGGLLPNFEERSPNQVKAPRPRIVNRVVVVTLAGSDVMSFPESESMTRTFPGSRA